MITRGQGSEGYLPLNKTKPSLIIETIDKEYIEKEDARIMISEYVKISSEMLPIENKIMQGLQSSLVRIEASSNNCKDAILLNKNGNIAEGSSSNIFWIKDNNIYTPSDKCDILQGTIRNMLVRNKEINIIQGEYHIEDLYSADSIFLTNVAWRILPVKEILNIDKKFNISKKIEEIQNLLNDDIYEYSINNKKIWQ